jgi:hypothetical protein
VGANTNVRPHDSSGSLRPLAFACQICGAPARRHEARYCARCGRRLTKDYFPTDNLRASYRQTLTDSHADMLPAPTPPDFRRRPVKYELNERRRVAWAPLSLAFVTYALVPYLGIIFCPAAILTGACGLIWDGRRAARREALIGLVLGLILLSVQLFLWWVLKKIPQWWG